MKSIVRTLLQRTLGDERLGAWEYRLRPGLRSGFGGPLNGSPHRRRFFEDVRTRWPIHAVVETGTFRGTSCEFFAATGLPVFTVEAQPRYFGFSQARLRKWPNVHLRLGDSRSFLRALASDPAVPKRNAFFYLDAHWYADLPLRDEVTIIFTNWENPVVMIDDFQVPGDSGYRWDNYGGGNELSLAFLDPVAHLRLASYFPRAASADEVGMKRGWVVLASDPATVAMLEGASDLRRFSA